MLSMNLKERAHNYITNNFYQWKINGGEVYISVLFHITSSDPNYPDHIG